MRSDLYQYALIFLGAVVLAFFGVFVYREVFPEYKIYQNDYIALEKFRSNYTHEPPPAFKSDVKQIVLEREDKGPPVIDRCISCHVALQFPHFSPKKIAYDSAGKEILDSQGNPLQVANEDYIWKKVDEKIASLTDDKVLEQLRSQGDNAAVRQRISESEELTALKTAHVDGHTYDVTKVLQMHPLIGKETRPFEFHPMEDYGCVSCHNGNGRGLTTEKAHGPVFDGKYEIEFLKKPQFTEPDPKNDPVFAYVFNDKPGGDLVFQTTPILPGALIQSKCVQCHQSNEINDSNKDIFALTKNFHQGEQLFVSQACYACHRITGMSRGRVGPELTRIGNSYPWYIKESIVWPQADLPTSTMPNYRLDHEELEDLMTFLLAQKGENRAIAGTDYKTSMQAWEAGNRKSPWEKPATPSQMRDLRYSMTVFAVEGCAACHRLKGYESNTGFRIEKDQEKPSFDALWAEHKWFEQLFPETIVGSEIVKALDKYRDEIDKHIVDDVRQNSLLEEIDKKEPETLEAFYSNFKYAYRAKNHDNETPIATETEQQQWKDRVKRVLMMFIQEYGLGRMICPKPNWSGVNRTDEWLMEHFRNPTSHVPRSIMPVFPFDNSKFYALTHMLDVLGVRNRNEVRAIWQNRGFDPALAVQIHCAQCHGEFLLGNGPISEWIYPIPKNLRNANFLRNLTKERVIQSITHGVKGTPMPPWGESPKGDGIPVLTKGEIEQLANWLFSSVPGGEVIKSSQDVPKWQYSPEDVLEELHREGNILKSESSEPKKPTELAALPTGAFYYASLVPEVSRALTVDDIFDIRTPPVPGPDKYGYYIKKKFYTVENNQAGQRFFELNCAVCHGKEADGSGARAEIMQEAKPRMLNNLDWIDTHDDLYLLRSIKYGMPGTAMTPWGDFTSSLQRLQLVIFIRSLSQENQIRNRLSTALYQAFDQSQWVVEDARLREYALLDNIEKQLNETKQLEESLYHQVSQREATPEQAAKVYQQKLVLLQQHKKHQELDHLFLELEKNLKSQQDLYQKLGQQLIARKVEDSTLEKLLELIALNNDMFAMEQGELVLRYNTEKRGVLVQDLIKSNDKSLISLLDQIDHLQQQLVRLVNTLNKEEGNE